MTVSIDRTGYRPETFHAQVKQLFFAVCDLDRRMQRIRLEELCGDEPKLLSEVNRLLAHDVNQELFDVEKAPVAGESAGRALPLIDRMAEALDSKRNCGHVV